MSLAGMTRGLSSGGQLKTTILVSAVDQASSKFASIGNNLTGSLRSIMEQQQALLSRSASQQDQILDRYAAKAKTRMKTAGADVEKELIQYQAKIKNIQKTSMMAAAAEGGFQLSTTVTANIVKSATAATVGLAGAFLGLTRVIGPTAKQLSGIAAITGQEVQFVYDTLGKTLKNMMEVYPRSSTEIAHSLRTLAQAGLDVNQVNEAAIPIMNLSVATMSDFNTSAHLVVRVIKAMRMEMTETEHVTNILTYAVNNSVSTITSLADSLKFAMPVANQLGFELEDLTAGMMILQNAGLEAGIAGRSLQRALQKLVNPSSKATEIMNKYNISILDANGEMRDMISLVQELERVYGGQSDALEAMMAEQGDSLDQSITKFQTAADFAELFGIRGGRAMANLIGTSSEMDKFRKAMQDDVITSSEQAKRAMQNVSDQIAILKNSFLSALLTTNEFNVSFSNMVEKIKDKVADWGEAVKNIALKIFDFFENSDFMDNITGTIDRMLPVIEKLLPTVEKLVSFMGNYLSVIGEVMSAGNGFIAQMMVVSKVTGGYGASMEALNGVMGQHLTNIKFNIDFNNQLIGAKTEVLSHMEMEIDKTEALTETKQKNIDIAKDNLAVTETAMLYSEQVTKLQKKETDALQAKQDALMADEPGDADLFGHMGQQAAKAAETQEAAGKRMKKSSTDVAKTQIASIKEVEQERVYANDAHLDFVKKTQDIYEQEKGKPANTQRYMKGLQTSADMELQIEEVKNRKVMSNVESFFNERDEYYNRNHGMQTEQMALSKQAYDSEMEKANQLGLTFDELQQKRQQDLDVAIQSKDKYVNANLEQTEALKKNAGEQAESIDGLKTSNEAASDSYMKLQARVGLAQQALQSAQAAIMGLISYSAMYANNNKLLAITMAGLQGASIGMAMALQLVAASAIQAQESLKWGAVGAVIGAAAMISLTVAMGMHQEKLKREAESFNSGLDDATGPSLTLAEGGIVTRPSRALIGEAGPEAVIPLKDSNIMGDTYIDLSNSIVTETTLDELENRLSNKMTGKWSGML